MQRLTINCLYCGYNTSFIISSNNDIKNIKCFYCNETKLLKQAKVEPYEEIELKLEHATKIDSSKETDLVNKDFDEPVDGGNSDGYFPDLYDDFFKYSQ